MRKKRKTFKLLTFLLASFVLISNIQVANVNALSSFDKNDNSAVIDVTDFGADPSGKEDSAVAIWNALEAAKELSQDGTIPVTVNFPEGEYHIYKDYAQTREYHTSNTNSIQNPIKTIGILIEDQKNLTIEGNESMFVMHGNIMALAVVRCENVKLNNFSWEYGVATTSEMTVMNIGEANGSQYTDYYIPSSYPHEINGNSIKWLSEKSPYTGEYYWEQTNDHGAWAYVGYNPNTKVTRRYQGNSPFNRAQKIERIDENTVRITFNSNGRPQKEVLGFVYEFCATPWRETAGAFIWESKDTVIDSVNVHYMHGFGWLTQMSENVSFYNCNFMPREGSGRLTTSYADLIHVSGAKGTINIENCNFAHAHDDPINIHGTFTRVEEKIDSNTLKLKYIENQQGGFQQYYVGDEVVFAARDGLTPLNGVEEIFTVTSVINPFEDGLDGKNMIVTFDKELPSNITDKIGSEPKYVAENITYTPTVNIKNNTFQSIPTRGILCTTRKPVVIEGNVFKNMTMQTIFLSNDSNAWYESGPINDMTIRNNTFYITNSNSIEGNNVDNQSAIHIHPEVKNGLPSNETPVHKNITIDGNTFYMDKAKVVEAESVENLVITNNKVIRRDPNININIASDNTTLNVGDELNINATSTGNQVNNDVISLTKCKNVTISGNTFDDGLKLNIANNNSIEINNEQPELTINGSNLKAPVSNLKFASTNPTVATINTDGNITALSNGTTDIFAYYEWNNSIIKSNIISFVVNSDDSSIKPSSLTITNDDNLMLTELNSTIDFDAVYEPENIDKNISWIVLDAKTNSPTTSATINENGVLTAKTSGVVNVIASLNGVTDSRTVVISLPSASSVLSAKFTVLNEDTSKWTPLNDGNGVTITMQTGDLYGTWNAGGAGVKNLFLFDDFGDVSKDDMVAVVDVDNLPAKSGQSLTASFLLYTDNDNYITIGKKGHFNGIAGVKEIGGTATEIGGNANDNSVTSSTFAFYKNNNDITVYYKPNGGTWTEWTSGSLNNEALGSNFKLGFGVWGPSGYNNEITFKNLRVATGSTTAVESLDNLDVIPFMVLDNTIPTTSNVRFDKSSYEIGETATVSFDLDGEAGETLYRFRYSDVFGKVQTVFQTSNTFRIISGNEIECTVYAKNSYGRIAEAKTIKSTVSSVDSYKLSSLNINGTELNVAENNEFNITLPKEITSINLAYLSANSNLGKIKILKNSEDLGIDKLSSLGEILDITDGDVIEIQRLSNVLRLVKESYIINIAQTKSSEAILTSINIPEVEFNVTNLESKSYSIAVNNKDTASAQLNLTSNDSASEIIVYEGQARKPMANSSTTVNNFTATVAVNAGVNSYYVEVIAEDGKSKTEYIINLISTRSTDCTLDSITLNDEALNGFNAETLEYDVNLEDLTDSNIAILGTATDSLATVTYSLNGKSFTGDSINASDLNKGINEFVITVKATNTVSVKHYTVNLIIPSEENANLKNLSIDGVKLSPNFNTNTADYTATVSSNSININATTEESNGKIIISANGQKLEGTKNITGNLNVFKGENLIKVTSIAPNGQVEKVYTVTLTVTDIVYVSDLAITSEPVISAGSPAKKDLATNGNALRLVNEAGEVITYEKGLGVQASSELVYNIEGLGFTNLSGFVGIDYFQYNIANSPASVRFKIYLDDATEPAFDSVNEMLAKTPAMAFSVDVTSAKKVKFVAEAGTTNWNDHANWADAKFTNGNITEAISGDVNNDGQVTIGDLAIISKYFGYNSEDNSDIWTSISKYDLNNDNIIDQYEIEFISNLILN